MLLAPNSRWNRLLTVLFSAWLRMSGRGLIGKSTLTGLLLELRRFIAGAPQSEQGNDVGFW